MIQKFSKSFKKPRALREPDSTEHGYAYAVFLLGLRLRTFGEVVSKMQQRGYTERVIAEVTQKLLSQRYINDEQFVEIMLENFKQFKTYGYFAIKQKLLLKKLPKDLVEAMLEASFTVLEESAIAQKYMTKEKLSISGDFKLRQKLAYKLSQRGFRSEVISAIFSGNVPEED